MGQPIWKPLLLMVVLVFLFNILFNVVMKQTAEGDAAISYSRFREELAVDNVGKVSIKGTAIKGELRKKIKITEIFQGKETTKEITRFTTVLPAISDTALMSDLMARKVELTAISTESSRLPAPFCIYSPGFLLSVSGGL